MNDHSEIQKFIRKLNKSFVLTQSEVIHIRKVHHLQSTYFFHHDHRLYTEIHVIVDATSYHIENGETIKQDTQSLYLYIDSAEVLKATRQNLYLLLLDDCKLIREAAQDLYQYKQAS